MNEIKDFIIDVLDISRYPDYLVLICIFLVILLLFLMSVAMRFYTLVAFILFMTSASLLLASPFIYQIIMESYIKKIEFTLKHNDGLQYDKAYFVEGTIKNVGFLDFKGCSININFIPKNLKKLDLIKYKLRPRFQYTKDYTQPLLKRDSMDFKIVIPSPNENLNFNLQTKGACY